MRRFFLIVFGVFVGSNVGVGLALNAVLARLDAPEFCRWSLGLFILVQLAGVVAMIGARLLGYQPGTGMGRPLLSLLMIWNLLLALPTAVMATVWAVTWRWASGPDVAQLDPAWRAFGLAVAALPFVVALLATGMAVWQLGRFRVRRMRLSLPHLPAALRGLTIVHLSDLHIGKLTRGKVLDDIVEETNGLKPDLILLTGDLINMSLEDLPRAFGMLRAMKARYGLYLCEGNHDLIESRNGFESAAKASGIPFLLNEHAIFSVGGQRVQVLGLRWGEGMGGVQETVGLVPENEMQRLLAEREAGDFTILLAHHPEAFDAAAAAGIPLTLAGHTHGGQLMLTRRIGFGPWFYRYWSGLYRLGTSQLVVSNGTGNWFPLRIHAPAEIIHLTLD